MIMRVPDLNDTSRPKMEPATMCGVDGLAMAVHVIWENLGKPATLQRI
jgi:hypothetical protein